MKLFPTWIYVGLASLMTKPALSLGQNHIPNPSFEDYFGNCTWGVAYDSLQYWTRPECANKPINENACNNALAPLAGVPNNEGGHEYAHMGNGYVCLSLYTPIINGNPMTYPSIDLTEPLTAGEQYCIRLWLSLADSSSYKTSVLHCFLWYGPPSICNYQDTAWDTYAAVTLDITAVDTAGWTMVEGSFTATGGESNLTIGSFLFGDEIDTTFIGFHAPYPFARYYVDDVYLGACDVSMYEPAENCLVEVFPNPVQQGEAAWLNLECEATEIHWTIFDSQGRTILAGTTIPTSSNIQIPTSGLDSGTYTLSTRNEHGITKTRKLLVG